MKEILFLAPVFKEMIWGGKKLKDVFGYNIPSEHTGECWAVSAHENGDCGIACGIFEGKTLSQLWKEEPGLFGNPTADRFPLLTKIIDAKTDLSIQVHPDDTYAAEYENGSYGKTECWYVLDCEEDTQIVIGHHAGDREEMEQMIRNKEWDQFIRVIDVKKGDFFQIEPGCLHAIKGGSLILETQQNSDITYRVYDYDRLSDGKPRELHVEKSIDVINAPFKGAGQEPKVVETENYKKTHYITCSYYTVEKLDLNGSAVFEQDKPFQIASVIEGEGSIDGHKIQKGSHFIIPNRYGSYQLEGNMSLILSNANK